MRCGRAVSTVDGERSSMTLSSGLMDILTARGIDVELADRLGLASTQRGDGECLVLPFVREGKVVRRKYRSFTAEAKWTADKGGIRCAFNEDCLRDDALYRPAAADHRGRTRRHRRDPGRVHPHDQRSRWRPAEAGRRRGRRQGLLVAGRHSPAAQQGPGGRNHPRHRCRRTRRGADARPLGAARPLPLQVPDLPEGPARRIAAGSGART
jgi:hypothetical protein